MNKALFVVFLAVLFSCSTVPKYQSFEDAIESGIQKVQNDLPQDSKVAILDFKSDNQNFSYYIIEELYDKLINGGKFTIMERSRIATIAIEVGYQLSGEVDDNELINIGHQLGADYIITGQIAFSGEAYRLRVFAIDIEKGTRVASSSLNINPNDRQIKYLLDNTKEIAPPQPFSVQMQRKPEIGSISINTGNLEISSLSQGELFVSIEGLDSINIPAYGKLPINFLLPGVYELVIRYNDYSIQTVTFEIIPNTTTSVELLYKSDPEPAFPPVSNLQIKNLSKLEIDRYINNIQSGDLSNHFFFASGYSNTRYEAEKEAYVNIASFIITSINTNDDSLVKINQGYIDSMFANYPYLGVALNKGSIIDVLYDSRNRVYYAIAQIAITEVVQIWNLK